MAATVIDYRPELLDELLPMWRASFESGVGIIDPHPLDEQRRYFLSEVLPQHRVRLAMLDGRLVGFIAASNEAVAQLMVRVGFQQRGIGTMLLDWAKQQSDGSLWLYTFARNSGARTFYERSGFTVVAEGFEPVWQLEDIKYQWIDAGRSATRQ